MQTLFQNVLTASFHGSIVIAAVLILRVLLKKTPKKFLCFLWLLVGIRLLMPFEIRSDFSLQPQAADIPYSAEIRREQEGEALSRTGPQLSDYPTLAAAPDGFAVPEFVPEGYEEQVPGMEEPKQITPLGEPESRFDWAGLIPWVWLAVACCFGVYTLFAYAALKVQVRDAIRIPGGWESERIETAFILGFIRPQIYIPMGMPEGVRKYILAHERTHLEKGDHWFKMVGFLALAVHWFNPLVWAAYILLCKDIEMACDERVVRFMDLEERKHYSAALLTCSANRIHFSACPVAFGEVSVKERIKSVLNYKKPGFWISFLGIVAIVFVAVCLVTSPAEELPVPSQEVTAATQAAETTETPAAVTEITVKNPDELLAAIAPNTRIVLEAGAYILSEAAAYGGSGSEYYTWREVYDGYQLTLTDVENLTIRGSGVHVTVVETDPRYANVIAMSNCSNVQLENFTAGHTRNRGECGGGVIDLEFCGDIVMNRLGLYGCGVVGLSANNCDSVVLADCDVYDCSSSAVRLWSCRDVAVRGCRIYRIGDEIYGGYTLFDLYESSVLIEDNQLSDSGLICMMTAEGGFVEMKNNLFTGNRLQNSVFGGIGVSLTLEGNRFEDNSIRRWYEWEPIARDSSGKLLLEEDLQELYGTAAEPTEPREPQLEVRVSTVDAFLAAIGPNTDIVLEAELYDLSTATGYGTSSGTYYTWEDNYDGPGLIIRDVSNMTIRTATGDRKKHTISSVPRYADVLRFRACDNITLSGFTAGHTQEPGSCIGGVLGFQDSDQITVENCGLFGCGIVGVQANYCSGLTVKNTEIYECSQGGIQLWNVSGIRLEDVVFRDIGGSNVLALSQCTDAMVDGKRVIGGEIADYRESSPEQTRINELRQVLIAFSDFYLNNEEALYMEYTAGGFAPEPYVRTVTEGWPGTLWFEVSYSHVQTLEKTGSLVYEVPYRESDADETRWLLVTVVEEEGAFKVSGCQVKR